MVTAVFNSNSDYAQVNSGLRQWDYGQTLRIQGLNLPTAVEVHFALQSTGGTSTTRVGVRRGDVTEVPIPDLMLENEGVSGARYNIYAFIYLTTPDSGQTIKKITMIIETRPKPEGFDSSEDVELFRDAILAVNESANRSEKAAESAEQSADEAGRQAEEAKDLVMGIPGHIECAKKHIDQYVEGKEQELKGDTGNVYFAAFKVINGRLKMYSDPMVDKVRFKRRGSRLSYRLEV